MPIAIRPDMPWQQCLPDAANWLAVAYPCEGCGLIVEAAERYRFVACDNLVTGAAAAHRYELDPIELIRAADRGERVVAVVHSHIDASDDFSAIDVAAALMDDRQPTLPGVDYLVVSVIGGRAARASMFRFDTATRGFSRVWSAALG